MLATLSVALIAPALALPGDFDKNGRVDSADLGRLIAAWNTTAARYDLNEDGAVDAADIGLLVGYWGDCP